MPGGPAAGGMGAPRGSGGAPTRTRQELDDVRSRLDATQAEGAALREDVERLAEQVGGPPPLGALRAARQGVFSGANCGPPIQ
jgi:hypothetical protein